MKDINNFDNYSVDDIIEEINYLEKEKEALEKLMKRAKGELLTRNQENINEALSKKAEPFGSVTMDFGDVDIEFNTPKKVEWDQEGLADLYKQIASDPEENVAEYICVEYKVKEDAYKNWPSNLKEAFIPHRTVKAGTVSVKIKPKKE